ncbi:MAG: cation:proton antiporter [Rhodocyclaceae bacterium]|nr:cation:proton antiporter [Rhodocyclaceae bacterium]MCA3021224.1 cation:proton antiporter [Rhodocyclaceae bacterium]MCA3026048.1 cation:proton antiporter [Rhodocyclaceae bacterium]MCA3031436.1 cation:proton antiporter [Rhodocyclaceae bacterium]MCA3036505.1 cation:proton antiporter [Rhodocyclaceae bacterium]
MHSSTLSLVVMLLATAVVTVVFFRRINMPAILGYLIVGVAIGPHAAGLVPDSEGTSYMAEFGVVFLMFSIGLEFSLPQLVAMRRVVFGFGLLQVLVTIVVAGTIAILAGQTWQAALVIGGVLAMSSTAIISKVLAEQAALHSPHGKQTMGVLLFQDLAVIPLLVLVPALSLSGEEMIASVGISLLKAAAALALILFIGQRLMRPLFHLVASQKSSELFVLTVLLVTLGLALATEMAGVSLALGAFLAGMLIAETEYRYQVEDDIKPFRDVLLGLFFITIGMLLNFSVLWQNLVYILLVIVALLLIKFLIVMGLSFAFGHDRAVALRVALALAPAGEFGFVLLSVADKSGTLPTSVLQIVLAACIISMLLSPLLFKYMERIVLYLVASEWEQRAVQLQQLAVQSMMKKGHVIIAGYGRSGQSLARFLEQEKISITALDGDPIRVKQASAAGESVMFGDASKREVLTAAGIARASALVISFADTHTAMRILAHVRTLKPDLPVIVRTFDDTDVQKLRNAGADEIVAEVVEGSLMLATQTMLLLGVPLNRVLSRLRTVRGERYELMRGFFPGATDADDGVPDPDLPRLQSIMLDAGAAAIGKTIGEVDIGREGVFLIALRRGGVRQMEPDPQLCLAPGDILILNGSPENLARAEIKILQG